MNDHFSEHVIRLKAEKGQKWAKEFDSEFTLFKLCALFTAARDISGLSLSHVSAASGVSAELIKRIEAEDVTVERRAFNALAMFYTRKLAEMQQRNLAARTHRLGALVASMSPESEQFVSPEEEGVQSAQSVLAELDRRERERERKQAATHR